MPESSVLVPANQPAPVLPVQKELPIEERMLNLIKTPSSPTVEPPKAPAPVEEPPIPEETPAETPPAPAEEEVETVELDPDAPLLDITVKLEDGREDTRKWSLNEMKKGVMLQADYTRKTKELAREREAVPQQAQQQVSQVAQAYEQRLQVINSAVARMAQDEIGTVDWNKLSREDPAEFVRLSARANQLNQIFTAAQTEIAALQQQQQLVAQQDQAKRVNESLEVLSRDIPNWSNEHYATLLKAGREAYGFTHEEIASVTDARMIKVLNDAYQYQALKAARPAVEKRLASVPKVLKPGVVEGRTDQSVEADAQARRQLKKSGGKDMDAAAQLFLNRMRQSRSSPNG